MFWFVPSSSLSAVPVAPSFAKWLTDGDGERPGGLMFPTQAAAMHDDQGDHSLTWQSESHGISQLNGKVAHITQKNRNVVIHSSAKQS